MPKSRTLAILNLARKPNNIPENNFNLNEVTNRITKAQAVLNKENGEEKKYVYNIQSAMERGNTPRKVLNEIYPDSVPTNNNKLSLEENQLLENNEKTLLIIDIPEVTDTLFAKSGAEGIHEGLDNLCNMNQRINHSCDLINTESDGDQIAQDMCEEINVSGIDSIDVNDLGLDVSELNLAANIFKESYNTDINEGNYVITDLDLIHEKNYKGETKSEQHSKSARDESEGTKAVTSNKMANLDGDIEISYNEELSERENTNSQRSSSEEEIGNIQEDNNNLERTRKRKKRHFVNEKTWNEMIQKKKRERGEKYLGRKKTKDNTWSYDIERKERILKGKCNCKLSLSKTAIKCNEIMENERLQLFEHFWKGMTWDQRKIYVRLLITKKQIARKRNRKDKESTNRTTSLEYYLKKGEDRIRVCKNMFMNTLGVGEKMISNWLRDDISFPAKIAENNNEKGPVESNMTNSRCEGYRRQKEKIKEFFNELPKMESHYCRASSAKLYLEPTWHSKQELYNFYKNSWCLDQQVKPLSIASFHHVFDELNLSIFTPKKDDCDICVSHRTGNLTDEAYVIHQQKKDEAREEKNKDKDSTNRVFCMDLQSVLLCPRSNVSSLYFKTKLIVHNFTIYDMKTSEGYCYLWHEAAGGVSANNYSSIICKFLEDVIKTLTPGQKIILYSDGCASQNRNSTLANALLNLAMLSQVTIEQKFLEKGHTQMEADSMHSMIERRLKNQKINVPADYVGVCLKARQNPKPYRVQYLTYDFFLNFNQLQFISSLRPGRKVGDPTITDIRALKYISDGVIFYKLKHSEEYTQLFFHRRSQAKNSACPIIQLPKLYKKSVPIKKEKYDHLQSLKTTLEHDYHKFYDDLTYI